MFSPGVDFLDPSPIRVDFDQIGSNLTSITRWLFIKGVIEGHDPKVVHSRVRGSTSRV